MEQPNLHDQSAATQPIAQPQATDSFATNTPNDIKIVSQNVQGLENEEKLEYLARIITKNDIKPTCYKKHTLPETSRCK